MIQRHTYNRRETLWAYLFIAAPVLLFLIFYLGPLLFSMYASFTNWNILNQTNKIIGIDNFKTIFTDDKFWKAILNTGFMLVAVPVYMFFALLLALGYNRKIPGDRFFRLVYYLPFVSSLVALSVMWKWIFNAEFGLVNNFLKSAFNINGPDWLNDPKWIKLCIVLMIIWKMIGVAAIYYLAALQNIPKSYYESARLDGASGVQQFWHITFPMITPISFYLLIMYIIGTLQTLVEVYMFTTNGGQDYAAGTIVYYLWQKGFGDYQLGYACAVGLIFLVIVMAITLIQFKVSDKWVYEGN